MALSTITNQPQRANDGQKGYNGVSLTNFTNTSLPAVEQGSICEIGGAALEASSDEAITGWGGISNDTDVYIYLQAAGTVIFSDTAPTWDGNKQGYYNGTDRAIAGLYKDGSGDYTDKYMIKYREDTRFQTERVEYVDESSNTSHKFLKTKILEIGDWNMDSTGSVNVAHGLTYANIIHIDGVIRDDAANVLYKIDHGIGDQGYITIVGSNVFLLRNAGGIFDSTSFDSTSYNRGFIYIKHLG